MSELTLLIFSSPPSFCSCFSSFSFSFLSHRASEEWLRKLQAMEEAFTKLKQVTGVKNVEEMHEKFSTQKSNKLQLELEVKDAEHRLATAKKAFQKLETTFQELKSSGSGVAELNRDNINRLEELYSEARNDQKSIRADSDRISTVLVRAYLIVMMVMIVVFIAWITSRIDRIVTTCSTISISD